VIVRGCCGKNKIVLNLLPGLARARRLEILCIGAHCDDIEIGCGATLLSLQNKFPCRIHWSILSSTPERRAEADEAMRVFVNPKARGQLAIGDLRDGHLPNFLPEAKSFMESVRRKIKPQLIFTTREADRHQDHRLTNEVTWQTFRDHMICEYEIPKYDGDLATPNCYVPVSARMAAQKTAKLLKLYGSQRNKHWFTGSTFDALLRLRGIECRSPSGLAEAFHCRKFVFGPRR
jgi:LmbE family N-acetylglucosaminyl deacetylase